YERIKPVVSEADALRLLLAHQPVGQGIERDRLPFLGSPWGRRGAEHCEDHRRPLVLDLVDTEIAIDLLDHRAVGHRAVRRLNRKIEWSAHFGQRRHRMIVVAAAPLSFLHADAYPVWLVDQKRTLIGPF